MQTLRYTPSGQKLIGRFYLLTQHGIAIPQRRMRLFR